MKLDGPCFYQQNEPEGHVFVLKYLGNVKFCSFTTLPSL